MGKSNEVYDLVIDRLVKAHYAFGDRLLVKELSAETGASRQPIMSALNRLSAEGLVRIVPQVGCVVIDPSFDEISDFFLIFQRLEGLLAELAAQRRTDDDLRELKLAQQRLREIEQSDDPSSQNYTAINRAFHHTLHLTAHSPLLERKQRNNFNMSDFFITHSVGFGAFKSDAVREHDRIIDAIVKGQQERARLEAESHIAAVASAVLSGLEDRPSRSTA